MTNQNEPTSFSIKLGQYLEAKAEGRFAIVVLTILMAALLAVLVAGRVAHLW